MRLFASLGLSIVFYAVSAHAQNSPSSAPSNVIRPGAMNTICGTPLKSPDGNNPPVSGEKKCVTVFVPGCPINMHVSQGIGGGMLAVDENGIQRRVFAPRLRLSLNDLRPGRSDQKIVSATVTVRGNAGIGHFHRLNAVPGSKAKPEPIVRTLSVDLANWGAGGVEGDFRLPGFAFASRIDLESVTYEDGTTWKLSGVETCRVAPDLLMLINY